jgi:hypothetical protein
MEAITFHKCRDKEGKALNVVPMGVREEEVGFNWHLG